MHATCHHLCAATLLQLTFAIALSAQQLTPPAEGQWKLEEVPAIWKNLPGGRYGSRNEFAWFRCAVKVPSSWGGQAITLFIEGVDDAREVFVNGRSIGLIGTFPPEYRSGLGATMRFPIPADLVLAGETNVVAIRVYQNQGRGGFNVAAPVLFGNDQAMRLRGKWEARRGDDLNWAKLSVRDTIDPAASYDEIEEAAAVEAALKRLDDDPGPQPIASTLKQIIVPDDLVIDVPVGEPHVRQPLSMKWDSRGRLWVMQYLQYPTIAGLKMVSRDKYLRTVYDRVPPAPPNHFVGADKITIHEDTDGDGLYDQHKSFLEGLNLATSFAIGRGGVFVLNPPYLLFYRDTDGDDVPDSDPDVLLEGFGLEDSHSVANSLRWGPDGWLYSTQGSTVTGHIRRPGSEEQPVHSMGQLVWRYHPETQRYEIFAEGGGNSFGVEFDSEGRVYSGHNGGDTRGFHYVQGGYYRKGFGKHGALSNPFAYGYFEDMTHHKVPRFTHTFVIYGGGALPAHYNGNLFGCGPLQSHVVFSEVSEEGSSFQTKDLGYALESGDKWVRPVDIAVGPDGAIYVADMYEQRIDHASHYQGRIHRESGRIYRLRGRDADAGVSTNDIAALPLEALMNALTNPNRWHRQTALRVFADRRDKSAIEPLRRMVASSSGIPALNAFWAVNLSGGLDEPYALTTLDHPDPLVREWTVRLLGDRRAVTDNMAERFVTQAGKETDVHVRSQLASTARRLSAEHGLPIVEKLLHHDEDVSDIHVPLLLWWAIESHVDSSTDGVLRMFESPTVWHAPMVESHILERLMRRYAAAGRRNDLLQCAWLLNHAPEQKHRDLLLKGFESAFEGRSLADLPEPLLDALSRSGGGSLALRLRQTQADAVQTARAKIVDRNEKPETRAELIRIFGDIQDQGTVPVLMGLVRDERQEPVVIATLGALQSFDSPAIGDAILMGMNQFSDGAREVAFSTMAARSGWTKQLLAAVKKDEVASDAIPMAIVRKMLLHQDEVIAADVKSLWGDVAGASTAQMVTEITRILDVLGRGSGNPYDGKILYNEHCGKCHRVFENGGNIGPNLTAYKRDDSRQLLANIVNPSLEIREGFESFVIVTFDGRAFSGFIEDQDNKVVVVKSADGQRTVIEREDIDLLEASKTSLMPEQLLSKLSDQQLRDLFAYLKSSQPLP